MRQESPLHPSARFRWGPAMAQGPRDNLPDVRDGLTRVERIILHQLHPLQQQRGGRNVPTEGGG